VVGNAFIDILLVGVQRVVQEDRSNPYGVIY
jgi:hypothetical protein